MQEDFNEPPSQTIKRSGNHSPLIPDCPALGFRPFGRQLLYSWSLYHSRQHCQPVVAQTNRA